MNIGRVFINLKTFNMLSVVVPCYNEEENIPLIISNFEEIILAFEGEIEVILVNNGSTDNSKNVFDEKIRDSTQKIKVLNIKKNIGYGHGILSGLKTAKGDVLAWTHADLQTDPKDIISALNEYKKYNNPFLIIKGQRKNRNLIDAFFTWGMQVYSNLILNTRLNDINAQPKLFSNTFFKTHMLNAPLDFSLDLFLLYMGNFHGEIKTIDVFFHERKFGKAKGGGSLKGKLKLIKRTLAFISILKKNISLYK